MKTLNFPGKLEVDKFVEKDISGFSWKKLAIFCSKRLVF